MRRSGYTQYQSDEDAPFQAPSDGESATESSSSCGGCCSPCVRLISWLGPNGRLLIAVLLAVVIGVVMKEKDVKDDDTYEIISIPGSVWINGFKLIVLPLIFCNMVVAIYDMKSRPGGGTLGGGTACYYFFTTMTAIVTSLVLCNAFLIPNMGTIDLETLPDTDEELEPSEPLSILGQIERIIFGLFPGNIVNAAATNNLMGVIMFGIAVGYCVNKSEEESAVLKFIREFSEVIMNMVKIWILLTPIGVFSLILPKIATADLSLIAEYLGLMFGIFIVGLFIHTFVTLPIVFFITTRKNPYSYLFRTTPAIIGALSSSSSAATLPITKTCAVEYNNVDPRVADFVLPLGAIVNMDGTALKYPLMAIWMATAQGLTLGAGDQVTLAIICVLTTVGAAPIPTAGVAMWVMVLEAVDIPITGLLGLLFTIEWLVDRLETAVNVTSDGFCAGILNHLVNKHASGDEETGSSRSSSSSSTDIMLEQRP